MKENLQGRKVKVIEVTPEMAERWLNESNHHNRPLRKGAVERFADTMRAGEWILTAEPIAFCNPYTDSSGKSCGVTLINGQHRLWAVIESKKTVPMTIWWGCEPEEFQVIDQGRVRTHGDVLATTRPEVAEPTMIASTISAFTYHGLGYNSTIQYGCLRTSHINHVLDTIGPELAEVVKYRKSLTRMTMRPVVAALVLAQIANPSMTALVAQSLKDAVGFSERDPIRALHSYLVGHLVKTGMRESESAIFYKTCHALCARMRGEHMKVLRITGEGVAWLRDAGRDKVGPLAKLLFDGKLPQHFWTVRVNLPATVHMASQAA